MKVKELNEIEILSEISLEICKRLNEYKNNIRKDMVIGDTKIIMGIELVEKFIREINPQVIDEMIITHLDFLIDNYIKLKDSRMQSINNYMMMGINNAYNIVNSFVIFNSKNKKRVLENIE